MPPDDDISSFLSRPLVYSDISVQFITPGNAPGPNSGPVGTFRWMHGLENQTQRWRSEYSGQKRPQWLTGVDGPVVFIGEQCLVTAMALLSNICQKYKYSKPIPIQIQSTNWFQTGNNLREWYWRINKEINHNRISTYVSNFLENLEPRNSTGCAL